MNSLIDVEAMKGASESRGIVHVLASSPVQRQVVPKDASGVHDVVEKRASSLASGAAMVSVNELSSTHGTIVRSALSTGTVEENCGIRGKLQEGALACSAMSA